MTKMIETGDAPQSLVDAVADRVVDHIRTNALAPGSPLPSESAFAGEAGASRAVAREAFRSLAALRLIDVGNGRRARVAPADGSAIGRMIDHCVYTNQLSVQQIFDVRRTIELRTAALASLRRTDQEADEICALADGMKLSFATTGDVMELDISFHAAVARASRNPLFALLVTSFASVTRQNWAIGWAARPTDAERMGSIEGHGTIAAAIRRGDARAAEKAMADHFDLTVRALLTAGVV
ncbi:MAG: FadR/GntR family transcriptional regulator [Mesorhizobium sp.]